MASSYTTSLKIQEIGNGEQSGVWGSTTNTNWTLIEQAVAGVQTITMSNSNYTLTNLNGVSDEARNMVLVVQGTNSGIYQVIAPLNQPKMYVVYNNTTGGYAITIGASTGSIVTIPNGVTAQVYTDGTNTYSAQTGSAGNFLVNGNLSVTGNQVDVGNMSVGGTFGVTGTSSLAATSFSVSPTAPTPTTGDNSTKLATTAFVTTATGSLGTMASQNANNVAITGGTIAGTAITGGSISSLGTPLPVASGGIGAATLTANSVLLGNGTSALQTVAPSTSGNLLVSNGTTWTSAANTAPIIGSTWTNYTGTKTSFTTYTNSTGKFIQAFCNSGCNGGGNGSIYINGNLVANWAAQFNGCGGYSCNMAAIIPPGATYYISSSGTVNSWWELV